jgi:hypothetical protein
MALQSSISHPAAEEQSPAPLPDSQPNTPEARPTQPPADDGSVEARRTGAEIPVAIYGTIVAAYAWILAMAWLDFSGTVESTWLASVGIIVGIVFFGIPFVLRHTNHAFARARQRDLEEFLYSNVETATGRLPGWEACLQIMVIPICLALAATALGAVWVWEG